MDYLETCFMCESEFEVDERVVLVLDGTVVALAERGDHTSEFEQDEDNYGGVYCVECYGKILQEIHKLYEGSNDG